jgi:hypothetical protein
VSHRRAYSILACYALFAAYLFATHYRLLDLPFFWDEAGQFISQSWDLYTRGLIIPESALPNSHTPGLPIVLALTWKLFGYSIEITRGLMLLIGAAYLCAAFLLAVELLRGAPGAPAFSAAILLAAHPLIYTQSMMAQLDLPSAVFLTALFVAYTRGMERSAVLCALGAVAFKETALTVPLVLAFFAWRKGERRFALLLSGLPILLLANWFLFLQLKTGFAFGDGEYSRYNLVYPLHPVRLGYALLRRFAFLFIENFHLLPSICLLWGASRLRPDPLWRPVLWASGLYTLGVSVTGGAVLERYLLPVMPVVAAAFAAGLSVMRAQLRYGVLGVTAAGMLACLFINMPWPYALENNLAMVDLVEMQRNAAGLVEAKLSDRRVTTTWPLSDALEKPYLGYVQRRHEFVREIHESSIESLESLDWRNGEILILYSRSWQPSLSLLSWEPARWLIDRFFEMPRDLRQGQIERLHGFRHLVGYEQRGFWVDILIFTGD